MKNKMEVHFLLLKVVAYDNDSVTILDTDAGASKTCTYYDLESVMYDNPNLYIEGCIRSCQEEGLLVFLNEDILYNDCSSKLIKQGTRGIAVTLYNSFNASIYLNSDDDLTILVFDCNKYSNIKKTVKNKVSASALMKACKNAKRYGYCIYIEISEVLVLEIYKNDNDLITINILER